MLNFKRYYGSVKINSKHTIFLHPSKHPKTFHVQMDWNISHMQASSPKRQEWKLHKNLIWISKKTSFDFIFQYEITENFKTIQSQWWMCLNSFLS